MSGSITRREFLKLAAMLPLVGIPASQFARGLEASQQTSLPNVLVLVFDTLSAKHMSLYGYPRATTPNIDRFAERSTVFHKHYAGGSFTSPGTAALLTGALPWTQRAFNFAGTVEKGFERKNLFRIFDEAGYYRVTYTHNWLVEQMLDQFRPDISYLKPMRDLCLSDTEISDRFFPKDHDVALSTERVLSLHNPGGAGSLFLSMLDQVLETNDKKRTSDAYASLFPRGLPTNSETTLFILEDAINWTKTEATQAQRPFMGYIHLLPPHEPYNARREFIGIFDGDGYAETPHPIHPLSTTSFDEPQEGVFRRHYDEMIAYADSEFGRLYDALSSSGVLENTYIVFTSDHGQILERGTRGHLNRLLYDAIARIPLIISKPGQTERVDVSTPTSCVDLIPTLSQIAGQPIPFWSEGQVLPTFGNGSAAARSVFTVEAKSNAKQAPITEGSISMVNERYKLIHYLGYGSGYDDAFELYDLGADPDESNDLYATNAAVASDLRTEMKTKLQAVNRPYERA